MLLEFKVKNYKTFKDEVCFSMIPTEKQKDLEYSILSSKIEKKTYKAKCSSVIYGPNAAGKTNIISALDTLKNIIIRGNILNSKDAINNMDNYASCQLELIPNNKSNNEPVSFDISFIHKQLKFDYALEIMLGNFLDVDYDREIVYESLYVNNKKIFERTQNVNLFFTDSIVDNDISNDTYTKIANNTLNKTDLFITNGYKNIINQKKAQIFLEWIDKYLITICNSNQFSAKPVIEKPDVFYKDDAITNIACAFGCNSNDLAYIKHDEQTILCSYVETKNGKYAIPSPLYESLGTLRLINIFPLLSEAIKKGYTLLLDEFDASLHPMAIMNIINIFHNDEINTNNGQLIFNTHNPIFLNRNLFRRDEICFVDRDDKTKCSEFYSLGDFGTSGQHGVRKGEDYLHNYFINKYGAITDIDFSDIFRKINSSEDNL